MTRHNGHIDTARRVSRAVGCTRPAVVLHVRIASGTGGGPDKTILRSPAAIDRDRYQLHAAYIHPLRDDIAEHLAAEARRHNCPLHRIGELGPADPRTVWRLARLCKKLDVAIWHGHDYKSNLLGLLIRRVHPMKLITTVHGWGDRRWRSRWYEKLDGYSLPRYDRVVAVSPLIAQRCNAMGVKADRLVLIPNAIDPAQWRCELTRDQAREKLGLPTDALLLGSASRLCDEKGIDRLLPVLKQIKHNLPALRYLLIGDGPVENQLKQQTRQLGLGEMIIWAGWCKPLHNWYRAMDALVLPSRTEGLPNTLLEAMAMGVPVAATDVGGVRDLLDDGRCGLMLSDDPAEWSAAITRWLGDLPGLRQAAQRAEHRIAEHYSFSNRMQRMAEQYDRLLGRHQSATTTQSQMQAA